jgi:hypothetical protein
MTAPITRPKTAIEGAIELLGLQAAEADLKSRNHLLSIEERADWHIVAINKRARQFELAAAYPHANVLNPRPNVSHKRQPNVLRTIAVIVAIEVVIVLAAWGMRGCL